MYKPSPTPAQYLPLLQDMEAYNQFLVECAATPKSERPARFAPDLGYLHERLYRTVSGVAESADPFSLRLDSA